MSHTHSWSLAAHVKRAEIDEDDPIRHTAFTLLECSCGAWTAFPLENYALTTARYKAGLERELLAHGRYFDPVADGPRDDDEPKRVLRRRES